MHKPACNPREDGEERTFTIKTHGPCTMDNWFVSRLSVLFFFYQIPALTFLPLLSQLRFTESLFLQFVNLFYLIIRVIRCELDINLTPFVSFLAKFEQILVWKYRSRKLDDIPTLSLKKEFNFFLIRSARYFRSMASRISEDIAFRLCWQRDQPPQLFARLSRITRSTLCNT